MLGSPAQTGVCTNTYPWEHEYIGFVVMECSGLQSINDNLQDELHRVLKPLLLLYSTYSHSFQWFPSGINSFWFLYSVKVVGDVLKELFNLCVWLILKFKVCIFLLSCRHFCT